MIVKCEQCQTRFKIPDEKVTERGVKVRCTKCGNTFRVSRESPQTPVVSDPFAQFGTVTEPSGETTRPGVFALGVEATKTVEAAKKAPSYPVAPPAFDFGSLTPPGAEPPSALLPPGFLQRPAPLPEPASFDFSNFASPDPMPSVRPPSPSAPAEAGSGSPVAPPPAFDFAPATAPAKQGSLPVGVGSGLYGRSTSSAPIDLGPTPGAEGGLDDFFGGAGSAGSGALNLDGVSARAMFDIPAEPKAQESLLDIPPPEVEPPAPAPSRPPATGVPLGRLTPQESRPLPQAPPSRRRTAVGVVVNVVIATVLVGGLVVVGSAILNEGQLSGDLLSLESLKNTFTPEVDFQASDVSNGLYETRAGRSVFFVRGQVTNRSDRATRVVVKAEIVEDGTVVRSGTSWAGDPASPEELFFVDGSESLEALNRKVEARSLVVPSGAAAAFVVAFTEYPPDLKDFRVRVSARPADANPTAAHP